MAVDVLLECCGKRHTLLDAAILTNCAVENSVLRQYLQLFWTNASVSPAVTKYFPYRCIRLSQSGGWFFRLTLYGFYKHYCWTVFNSTFSKPSLSYANLRNAWSSFIDHVDLDTAATFQCDVCHSQPALVIGEHLMIGLINISIASIALLWQLMFPLN